jgi:hypothetical protein
MIAALIYALIYILLICGAAWLACYIIGVAGMPDPPARVVRLIIWVVAAVACLLVLLRVLLPALGPLP